MLVRRDTGDMGALTLAILLGANMHSGLLSGRSTSGSSHSGKRTAVRLWVWARMEGA